MRINKWSVAGVSAVAASIVGASLMQTAGAQQGVPSGAPKTGSGNSQPSPANSQPSPANSQPGPANPTPRPANNPGTVQPQQVPNRPATPAGQQPANTQLPVVTGPNGQPIAVVPGTVTNGGSGTVSTGLGRYERPFAFSAPGVESRFTDSSRRLVGMESRMNLSTQTLLRRLGEARMLPPEKQNAAMADIIQQMLLDQQQMQRYLVQARTAWTGELDPLPAEMSEEMTPLNSPADAAQPSGPIPTQVPVAPQTSPQSSPQSSPQGTPQNVPQNPPR